MKKAYLKQLTVNDSLELGTRVAVALHDERAFGVIVDATTDAETWFKVASRNDSKGTWFPYHSIFKIVRV